jgi:hypothetical protein
MQVRIYKPAKTAMQSGVGNTKEWVIDAEPSRKEIDPLMGWTSSRDTTNQVVLRFETREEAIAHAERQGWMYTLSEPKTRAIRPRAYADNFAFTRVGRWTH